MNESDFENELRALRPSPPGAPLAQRIAAELSPAGDKAYLPPTAALRLRGGIERLCWAGLGAAAAVWVMHGNALQPSGAALGSARLASAPIFPAPQPTVYEEAVTEADEGVHFVQADTPIKKVRRVVLERQAWSDPKGGGTLEVQWPREDVIYLPVPVQ